MNMNEWLWMWIWIVVGALELIPSYSCSCSLPVLIVVVVVVAWSMSPFVWLRLKGTPPSTPCGPRLPSWAVGSTQAAHLSSKCIYGAHFISIIIWIFIIVILLFVLVSLFPLLFISFPLIIIYIIIPPLHHFLAHLLRTLFVIIVLMIITIRYSLSRRHQSLSSMGTARRDRAGPGDRLLHFVVALSLTHTHPHTRCLSFTTSIKFNWVQFNCNVLYFYWGIKIKKIHPTSSPPLSLSPRLSLPPCHTLSVWQNGADRRRQSVQMPQSLTRTAEELKLKLRNSPGERVTAGEKQWKGSEGQWGSGGGGERQKRHHSRLGDDFYDFNSICLRAERGCQLQLQQRRQQQPTESCRQHQQAMLRLKRGGFQEYWRTQQTERALKCKSVQYYYYFHY